MRYLLEGHYPTLCNGIQSYVILCIKYRTKEEAEQALEDKKHSMKNMKITEVSE